MILTLFILLFAAWISFCVWRRIQIFKLRARMGLNGPETDFLTGNMKQISHAKDPSQPMMILNEWRKLYGNVFGYYFGPKLTVFVGDIEMAKEILIKKFDCFTDRMHFALAEPSPNCFSLVILEGEKWKQIRNSVTPTFTTSKMKQMSHIINNKIDTFLEKMLHYADEEQSFDIYNDFQALTLDVIGQCAFAMQVQCQTDDRDPFLLDVQEVFRLFDMKNFPLVRIALIFPELRWIFSKIRLFTRLNVVEQKLISNLRKVVKTRKEQISEYKSIDVLQLLLEQQADVNSENQKKWKLTDEAVLGNAYVFLLAGYETTSTALGFTAWLLAKHRDVQKKLQEEIDEKMESLNNDEDLVNYDFVNKLPYMDAVFHESLRVFPPVIHFVQRMCVKECIVGGIKFLPGVQVHMPVREIHYDPEIWPEPEKFDPERFLHGRTYPAAAWIPFGAGPRNCVGMRFAELEYKMTLVRTLHRFNFILGSDSEPNLAVLENSLLWRPKNGVVIRLEKRFG